MFDRPVHHFRLVLQRNVSILMYWGNSSLETIPLSQLLPVHSIVQFAIIRVLFPGPHIKQYFVLVVKTLPLGTSGV